VSVEATLPIASEDDIVAARQRARLAAKELGFSMLDQSRVATAVSELARNVVRYATDGRGMMRIQSLLDGARVGIEIIVTDDGPGIADIELVMRDGYTSGKGLGLGLPGTRRLMDELEVTSELGRGTSVTIRKWRG
jgi:serine/threonine-protein kinase RsbT